MLSQKAHISMLSFPDSLGIYTDSTKGNCKNFAVLDTTHHYYLSVVLWASLIAKQVPLAKKR